MSANSYQTSSTISPSPIPSWVSAERVSLIFEAEAAFNAPARSLSPSRRRAFATYIARRVQEKRRRAEETQAAREQRERRWARVRASLGAA